MRRRRKKKLRTPGPGAYDTSIAAVPWGKKGFTFANDARDRLYRSLFSMLASPGPAYDTSRDILKPSPRVSSTPFLGTRPPEVAKDPNDPPGPGTYTPVDFRADYAAAHAPFVAWGNPEKGHRKLVLVPTDSPGPKYDTRTKIESKREIVRTKSVPQTMADEEQVLSEQRPRRISVCASPGKFTPPMRRASPVRSPIGKWGVGVAPEIDPSNVPRKRGDQVPRPSPGSTPKITNLPRPFPPDHFVPESPPVPRDPSLPRTPRPVRPFRPPIGSGTTPGTRPGAPRTPRPSPRPGAPRTPRPGVPRTPRPAKPSAASQMPSSPLVPNMQLPRPQTAPGQSPGSGVHSPRPPVGSSAGGMRKDLLTRRMTVNFANTSELPVN